MNGKMPFLAFQESLRGYTIINRNGHEVPKWHLYWGLPADEVQNVSWRVDPAFRYVPKQGWVRGKLAEVVLA